MKINDYAILKQFIGSGIYFSVNGNAMTSKDLSIMIKSYLDCGFSMSEVRQSLAVLNLYDDTAAKALLTEPTLLISIDSIAKEMAWVCRMQGIMPNYDGSFEVC